MILSDVLTAESKGARVRCPGCGERLFDLARIMPVQTVLPTMEHATKLVMDIKCQRCGRRVGVGLKQNR